MRCPWKECGYIRKNTDTNPKWECPSCHGIYNKHPDYYGNTIYEIQLMHHRFPSDNQIQSGILYLYIYNEKLEGAFINKIAKVQRVIFTKDNLPHFLEFLNTVSNPDSCLSNDQEHFIFITTAQILTEQETNKEIPHQKTRYFYYVLSVLISISAISLTYIKFHNIEPKNSYINNIKTLETNTDHSQNIYELLTKNDVNLKDLASEIINLENLFIKCKNECSSQNYSNNCEKLKEFLQKMNPKIYQYRQFMHKNSIDGLKIQDKEMVYQINDKISSLSANIDLLNSICNQKQYSTINKTTDLLILPRNTGHQLYAANSNSSGV